jgi:hypothetical protein
MLSPAWGGLGCKRALTAVPLLPPCGAFSGLSPRLCRRWLLPTPTPTPHTPTRTQSHRLPAVGVSPPSCVGAPTHPQEATPAWYASLTFASWVDARRSSSLDGRLVWSRGQIVEEVGDRFHVHFYHATAAGGVPYDMAWYPKTSPDLAPEGTKVWVVPCARTHAPMHARTGICVHTLPLCWDVQGSTFALRAVGKGGACAWRKACARVCTPPRFGSSEDGGAGVRDW